MSGLYGTAMLVLAGILLYHFRGYWLGALKRFDAENRARQEEDRRDRKDPLAHFKHTLRIAGEEVEEVGEIVEPDERTGDPVTRYIFGAEKFATREEAEEARNIAVVAKARIFYRNLPEALAARRGKNKLN